MHTFLEMIHNLGNGLHFIGLEADKLYKFVSKKVREAINMRLEKCTGDDLIDYKVYGNSKQSRLPDEYQEVEYIEGTGTQHIDTGIDVTDTGYKSETVLAWTDISIRQIMGSYSVGYWGINASGMYEIYTVSTEQAEVNRFDKLEFSTSYQNSQSQRTLKLNDNEILNATSTTHPAGDLWIFGVTGVNDKARCKLKYQKIWVNDVLVRDFIPCYKKSNGTIGLYDMVNGVFYSNNGTGTFIKGPDCPNPDNPDEIQSVGDLVTSGEHAGKYKIPIKISGINKAKVVDCELTSSNYSLSVSKGIIEVETRASDSAFDLCSGTRVGQWLPNYANANDYHLTGADKETYIIKPVNLQDFDIEGTGNTTIAVYTNQRMLSAYITSAGEMWSATVSLQDDEYIKSVYLWTNGNNNLFKGKFSIQLQKSNDNTYEPYHEPITKYIYLDEPLHKIGDIADDIDFGAKKRINKVGVYDFDDFPGGAVEQSVANPDYYYAYSPVLDELALANDSTADELCTRLKVIPTMITRTDVTSDSIALGKGWAQLRVMILKSRIDNSSGSTLMYKLRTFFSENPTLLFYKLTTPTEENIDLPEIPTFEGTTIIEVDTEVQPSNMWVQYYAKE